MIQQEENKGSALKHAQEDMNGEGENVGLEPVTKIWILRSFLETKNVGR